MVLQHSFNQQKSRRFGLLSWSRAVPSKGSALPRAIAGGQSCVKDSRSFSPSRRWNIPPSLVPSRVLAESQQKIDLVERWQVKDGFGRKAVVTTAVGRVRWTEFFVFFVTHRTGDGNGHIYASGWDELWDVIFYMRLHGWSLRILDESHEEAKSWINMSFILSIIWINIDHSLSHSDSSPKALCRDPLQHLRRRLGGAVKKLSRSCDMLLRAICLLRGWGMHPYDSIPWRRKSIMKILSFDNTLEYVLQGSDSTENFMTRMACPWSWFVWYAEIHMQYTSISRQATW